MAGYSGTPLIRKLGIRPQERVFAINAPKNYEKLLGDLPEGASVVDRITSNANFIHLFVRRRANLAKELPRLRNKLADTGTLWVSWPKESSGVPTDVTEDVIREVALPLGVVDTKVCAVDETWSGLKLMIRRTNRRSRITK
jgi:hypothetical protein